MLEASFNDDRDTLARLLNCTIPADYPLGRMPSARRLAQLRADPAEQPWLLRAMVDRASNTLVGHIGFHAPPGAPDLPEQARDGVELGYTVHAPFRRMGYASEAAIALMRWAFLEHGQRAFLLSISPENVASTAMAASLGFVAFGSHIDDEDGLEIEYLRRLDAWPAAWDTRKDPGRSHDASR